MQVDACYQLGYVIKKHGLNGEVNIYLDVDFPEEYSELESVFVEINQKLVPFFIEHLSIKGKKAVVKFEEVDTLEAAEDLRGKSLFLPLDNLPQLDEGQFYYHQVEGYMLIDNQKGEIGKITSILTGPQQDLFAVDVNGTEVLVPITDEIIDRVDHEKSAIFVNLPDGLLEVYLEP